MSTDTYSILEATAQFSKIIDLVERGEEIVITRAGVPVAKLVPLNPRAERTGRGSLAGRIRFAEDWNSEEVNRAIAEDFGPRHA